MTQVNHIADFILLTCQEAGDCLTNLKLQKLLYYAQAWYLALNNKRLFNGLFEAWIHGPVHAQTYQRFKKYGCNPIGYTPKAVPEIPDEEKQHIRDVLDVFSSFSAYDLERMTHQESPWINARGNLLPDEPSNEKISEEDMRQFYQRLSEEGDS